MRAAHTDLLCPRGATIDVDADAGAAMAVAFEEAVAHVQRKGASCYEPVPPGQPNPHASREELATQAAALTEMAERSAIDPVTVARAQAALERDLAWLARIRAGLAPGEPAAVVPAPAEVEAARLLVELLLAPNSAA